MLGPGGLAAAAVGVTSVSTALMTGTTTAVAPAVDLVALVTPANSTSQIFAGTTYYGTDWTTKYGEQHVVPFFLGPQGIENAIIAHKTDPTETGVVSSGWGAGQTGTALSQMSKSEKSNVAFVILDNNTNRAGGGFWTTYAPFAPLLATSAEPTPKDLEVPALDVAYEYNINSSAPVDPLNPFAVGNSLAAYLYGYGAQSNTVIPYEVMADAQESAADPDPNVHYAYVIDSQGNILNKQKLPGSRTTYVTVQAENLPLTRPLRLLPGGDIVADAIDPTVTQLVNAGYNDGKGLPDRPAIPKDPTVTRPMQPGSSFTALSGVQVSTLDGRDAGTPTAVESGRKTGNLATNTLDEADNLPVIPSQSRSTPMSPSVSGSTFERSSPNKFAPKLPGADRALSNGSSAIGRNGLNDFADRINDTVNRVTGRLTSAKPTASDEAKSNDTLSNGATSNDTQSKNTK